MSIRRERGYVSELNLVDCTSWSKVLVRTAPDGRMSAELALPQFGRASRLCGDKTKAGAAHESSAAEGIQLAVGWKPDGWLLLSETTPAATVVARFDRVAAEEFVSAVDVTHGYWLGRLSGPAVPAVLTRICAIDLADAETPDGAALSSLVAGITATVIRDDRHDRAEASEPGQATPLTEAGRSYLVLCERSYGRYLADTLADAAGST